MRSGVLHLQDTGYMYYSTQGISLLFFAGGLHGSRDQDRLDIHRKDFI